MAQLGGKRRGVTSSGIALATLIWLGAVGGCGGKASTTGERASGDGDSVMPRDGDGDAIDRTCEETADCLLVSATCCGTCARPTLADVTAIRISQVAEHLEQVCEEDAGCPDCLRQNNPNLFAVCEEGTCQSVDLTEHSDSECTTSDDCILLPDACCECGAVTYPENTVAIRPDRTSDFIASQCSQQGLGEPIACDTCAWSPAYGTSVSCSLGHCAVAIHPI